MDSPTPNDDLVHRLRKRAEIRRQITTRKSVQNNEPDRIADLLEEAANKIEELTKLPPRNIPRNIPAIPITNGDGPHKCKLPKMIFPFHKYRHGAAFICKECGGLWVYSRYISGGKWVYRKAENSPQKRIMRLSNVTIILDV